MAGPNDIYVTLTRYIFSEYSSSTTVEVINETRSTVTCLCFFQSSKMTRGRLGKGFMGPLLVADMVVYLIILALASWSLNNYIDGQQSHPHLGGNSATNYMLLMALLAGTTGAVSIIVGLAHFLSWSVSSMAAAISTAAIARAFTGLAFGLAWKEIKLGGRRGKRLQTLEVLIIVSTLIHLLYILLLHAGHFNQKYGPYYGERRPQDIGEGPSHEARKSTGNEPNQPDA
ncbi:membrane protein PM19L-like [Silene latifolia]|uniref:membrane protein PM19L-like n=1 Tax=Silene latifolia TaxID=37657 RepID=UPI003D781996